MNAELAPLNSLCAARRLAGLGLSSPCRTVTRRAERLVCALAAAEPVNPEAIKYPQPPVGPSVRARPGRLNGNGRFRDVLWQPGATREG